MAKQEPDLWTLNADGTKDPFSNINWNMPDLPDLEDDQPNIDPVLQPALDPEVVSNRPAPVAEPVLEPEPEVPKVYEVDGGTITLEKDKGQWKLTIANEAGGNQQVFWGKTKDELLVFGMGKAQLNATKKIREQNREIKLGRTPAKPVETPSQPSQEQATIRDLTADEIFEYETLHKSNPAKAFDFLLQKTRGITIDYVLKKSAKAEQDAQAGSQAANTLWAEQTTKTFLQNNPDYYSDPNWENYGALVKWLMKFKLGEPVRKGEEEAAFDKLVSTRTWSVENLEEAFKDLSDDDLLVRAPRQPNPPPPVVVEEPVPAPRPDSRIVSQVTRPRAALGIRPSDVTPVRTPETPNAPSAEDFDSMTDEEHSRLWAAIQQEHAKSRRSK